MTSVEADEPTGPPAPGGRLGPFVDRLRAGFTWPCRIVVLGSLAFAITMLWISWLKYETFNASFLDLGLTNHIYWLLSHGGLPEYQQSGQAFSYPIQYEEPIYFLVLPLYGAIPGIPFLLALQAAAIGFSAVPLYLFVRRRLEADWTALLVAGIYLSFFTLYSAVLFDYHNESLFPLLFFSAILAQEAGHRRTYYALGLLAALIDPLCLLIVVFFTLTLPVPSGELSIRAKLSAAFREVRARPGPVAFAGSLVTLLAVYGATGHLFGTFSGTAGATGGPVAILLNSIDLKFEFFLYLFGAVVFLPLLRWRTVFALIPYIGFVMYSTASAHWSIFGNQYPLLATVPLFYGLVLALDDLRRVPEPVRTGTVPSAPAPGTQERAVRFRRHDRSLLRLPMVKALVVVAGLFAIIYVPVSPLNQYVAGGIFQGNADLPVITTVTPDVQFLWKVIDLIPSNASVLTQNNIPQLSSREYVETPVTFNPSIPYQFILLDTSLTYFAETSSLSPYIESALSSHAFGILAEGEGALLLERGYAGRVVLFQPTVYSYTGSQLVPYAATVVGTTIVGGAAAGWMWYGPYVQLLPGNYTVNFTLSSNRTAPVGSSTITLDVESSGVPGSYAAQTIHLGNFTDPEVPMQFELRFTLPTITSDVEFRGVSPTGVATLTLWGITVTSTP